MNNEEKALLKIRKEQEKIKRDVEKEKIKSEKFKQKMIARTRKKAKVPNNATYEEANEFILKYAFIMKSGFEKLYLTDEQKNDPEFLLKLYNTNLVFTCLQKPDKSNKELTSNVDFMIEYFKLEMRKVLGQAHLYPKDLERVLSYNIKSFTALHSKQEFFEKLIEEYPNINLINVIMESVKHVSLMTIWYRESQEQQEKAYKELILSLPKELIIKQVENFGLDVLKQLPKELPYYAKLVDVCITKEGFKALKQLPVEQVLENKDLVIKAYSVDGVKALAYYIMRDLEPNRTISYMCHGDDHWYTEYNEEYAVAQKGLLEDETIKTLFNISKKALQPTSERFVKMTLDALHLLDNEETNTENKPTTPTNDKGEEK